MVKHRAFIGFYGLNRSARWTARSIRKNITTPLRKNGFEMFTAGYFNKIPILFNGHSGEINIPLLDNSNLLNLDLNFSKDQKEEDISDMAKSALSVPWFMGQDEAIGDIRRNLLYQLHSLRKLHEVVISRDNFDIYLLLRPDLEYLDKINMEELMFIIENKIDILTPRWETWEGVNDRFIFCNRSGCEIFLNRWRDVNEFIQKFGYLHAEKLLSYSIEKSCLKMAYTDMRAQRVRANGKTEVENFQISPQAWFYYRARGKLRAYAQRISLKLTQSRLE